MKNNEPYYGFITDFVKSIFSLLKKISITRLYIGDRCGNEGTFCDASMEEKNRITRIRAKKVDKAICAWVGIEVVGIIGFAAGFIDWILMLLFLLMNLRILEICQYNINMLFFDAKEGDPQNSQYVASITRIIIAMTINFLELILCFGYVYSFFIAAMTEGLFGGGVACWSDGYYFSVITQLTIGYGDITPQGWMRFIASFQGLLGYFFSILLISRFVSMLPNIRSVAKGMNNPENND